MATHPVIGLFSGIIAILLSLKGDGLQESYTQPISPNGIRGIGQEHYVLCNVNSVYGVNHGHYIVADLTCQIHTKSTKICKVNSRSDWLHILISLLLAGDVHPITFHALSTKFKFVQIVELSIATCVRTGIISSVQTFR